MTSPHCRDPIRANHRQQGTFVVLISGQERAQALAVSTACNRHQSPPTERIKKDGKLLTRLMKAIAVVEIVDHIEVDPDRPTIAAGNHQSLLDVFMAVAFCYQADVSCRLVVQARYFESKLGGRWLRRIGCIPLSTETKEEAFAEVRAALAAARIGRHHARGSADQTRGAQRPRSVPSAPALLNSPVRPGQRCDQSLSTVRVWRGRAPVGQRSASVTAQSSPCVWANRSTFTVPMIKRTPS